MISSAMTTASGGMRTATLQFERAARDIAGAGTGAPALSTSSADPATASSRPLRPAAVPVSAIAEGVLDLKLAEISYKANIKVFEAAARLGKTVLDMFA